MPPAHHDKTTTSQVDRVIARFGTPGALRNALKAAGYPRDLANIYRWRYPKSRGGTGGLIPSSAWPGIHAAARLEGIHLTADDLDPREL